MVQRLPSGVKFVVLCSRHQLWVDTHVFKHRLKVGAKIELVTILTENTTQSKNARQR